MSNTARERLIVALDVATAHEALELVSRLKEHVGMFKIGSQLFTAAGPELVEKIIGEGQRVFLDLKFHDIPHQVSGAVRSAIELGVSMITIHASGGPEMMKRAVATTREVANRKQMSPPFVVAVTLLTSIDSAVLNQLGITGDPVEAVVRLASIASLAGVDGVVASPKEIATIRSAIPKKSFLVVTPGIRPETTSNQDGLAVDDQKRVASPGFAIAAGASYLVVGRPITEAGDVAEAAARIIAEMGQALAAM